MRKEVRDARLAGGPAAAHHWLNVRVVDVMVAAVLQQTVPIIDSLYQIHDSIQGFRDRIIAVRMAVPRLWDWQHLHCRQAPGNTCIAGNLSQPVV